MYGFIKRNRSVVIITIASLIVAFLFKMNSGNVFVFYAYHSATSMFPGRMLYFVLYLLRIILASVLLSASLQMRNCVKCYRLTCVLSVFYLVSVLVEFKLVFCLESILTALILCFAVSVGLTRTAVELQKFRRKVVYVCIFLIIELYMAICLLSVIV